MKKIILLIVCILSGAGVAMLMFKDRNLNCSKKANNVTQYNYSFATQATSYEPNPDKYAGFLICNVARPSCEIYGVLKTQIKDVIIDNQYQLSFQEIGACTNPSPSGMYCELGEDAMVVKR